MTERRAESNRRNLLTLLSRKRKRKEQKVEIPREPVRLNFLFVGSKGAGQTSLLL
jgi:Ras family protein A